MNITNKVDGYYSKGDIVEWTDWMLRNGYGEQTFGRLISSGTRWETGRHPKGIFFIHITDEFHPSYDKVVEIPSYWGINHKRSK